MTFKIGILGSGAWGTALALVASRDGHDTLIWGRSQLVVDEINHKNTNCEYLPNIDLEDNLSATTDISRLSYYDIILSVVPAQATYNTLKDFSAYIRPNTTIVICAKGLDQQHNERLSPLVERVFPDHKLALLSGPSFAMDVALGKPTAVTIASKNLQHALELARLLSTNRFRCYATDDVIGVELGGALKNVLAIGAGISTGAGFGQSAQAALITRGFVELRNIAQAAGARHETIMGLAGLGDLMLTASSEQSRNYAYGLAIGQGKNTADLPLAEGSKSAIAALEMAKKLTINTPIIEAICLILSGELDVEKAAMQLLDRTIKAE